MHTETWQGRCIDHAKFGRGQVLTDLADRATHTRGQMLVQFDGGARVRRWVDAGSCMLVTGGGAR